MDETTPVLSSEQREALLDEFQDEHPETWYASRIVDCPL